MTATTELRYVAKDTDPDSSHAVILAAAGHGAGRRLLDVGAAQGALAKHFTEAGFQVTCLEGDPHLAALARKQCREVIVADLDAPLPELDEAYDVIVYGDILEHLKNPLAVLQGLNRYLAPSGMVVVSVPNVAHLYIRLQLFAGCFEYTDRGILDRTHLRFFTLATFKRLLSDAGLQSVKIVGTAVPLYLVWPGAQTALWLRLLQRMNAFLARHWKTTFGYQFVAICRKENSA